MDDEHGSSAGVGVVLEDERVERVEDLVDRVDGMIGIQYCEGK